MKNKILMVLIGMCIGGILYGCTESEIKASNNISGNKKNDSSNFQITSDIEIVDGNKVYVIRDNQYEHEYIVIDAGYYGGVSIVERDTK